MKDKKIGLFAGSFDPFTIGHQNIVDRALTIFDEVIILLTCNSNKKRTFHDILMVYEIQKLYEDNDNVIIKFCNSNVLTIDIAKSFNVTHLIRGIRSTIDFEYEKNIGEINQHLGNIDTVYLMTEPNLSFISSSFVRELIKCKKSVDDYLPFYMGNWELIRNNESDKYIYTKY